MKYTVYIIRHISTGMVLYVGKTNNFKRRVYQHLSLKSSSKEWLSSIGTNNVIIEAVAEFNNKVDALKYEDELIIKYGTIENGYNKNRSGLIATENIGEYQRKWQKEYYQKNDKFREYQRNYQREYQKKYQGTDEFKEYQRNWHRDYYHAKKLGISIDEYRKIKQNKNQPTQLTINF